jgi:hypothetical protein
MDIISANIKTNFALTDNLDASLGYRYTSFRSNDDDVFDGHLILSGFTIGLAYKFGASSQSSPKTNDNNQENNQQVPSTKTLILKNDFHGTQYELTVNHSGEVKVGDVIELTANQVQAIKNALCGGFATYSDGELGIRPIRHKLGNIEVNIQEIVKHDSNKQIVGASLTITQIF